MTATLFRVADDPVAPETTVPDPPDFGKIGKYDLEELVGEGAMGKVYRAQDPVLGRAVAIKLMSASISQDAHLRDRFLREARAAANLQHPNIITIYDFGDAAGHPYIAMEFVEGTDLHHVIQDRQPVSLESKVTYLIGLLNGLAYAHTKGVVHRDIKPANIRVTASGHVKIMDFGIAHLSGSEMTHSGVVLGTPDYMAPEQVRGMPVTPQTDIWAAGAVLYELLTFEKPFSGETLHAVLFKVVTEEPPAITKLNPSLPEALERIVNTALNKEAGRRYSAADAMAADLSSVRKHLSELETKATLRFSRPLIAMELPLMERLSRSPLGKGLGRAGALLATTAQVVLKPAKAWLNRVPVPAPLRSGSAALAAVGVAVIGVGAMVLVALAKGVPVEAAEVTARALVVSDTAPSRVPAPQIAAVAPTSPPVAAQRTPRRTSEAATAPRRPATPTGTAPITDPKTQPVAAVPAATASDPKRAVREAVERLERAMASADVSRIKALYPGLTSSSAKGWEDFFRPKKNLTADFRPGDIKVKDESAEATFQMRFAFVDAAGAKKTIDWTGEGKLEKTPTGWVWKSLGLKR